MYETRALLGRTFGGRFLITATLGEGAMGAVLRASRLDGGGDVAVKSLHASLADDPMPRARFQREAQMAARIDHPNVVQILDHGMEDGIPYLVMELVEGRELFDVLARAGRLPAARAAAITLQICDAVATAHDLGIIHRDLKPENVMLVGDPADPGGERVKLLDFGVAKQVGSVHGEDGDPITMAGSIVGTPAYMSPEQCQGGTIDVRSDVYACGAVLYHLVTGRAPFEDGSPVGVLYRHVHEAPRPPSLLVPDLDPAMEAAILKALAKRPEDRHQGVHELWEELLAMLPGLSGRAPTTTERPPRDTAREPTWALPPTSIEAAPPRPRRAPSGRRWVPLVVSLAAALSLALGLAGSMSGLFSPAAHELGWAPPTAPLVPARTDR